MAPIPHLIFGLGNSRFAVPAAEVREIISLPELTPLALAPHFVAGMLNLRGTFIPVVDLQRRLGGAGQPGRVDDSVIVLENGGSLIGLIVHAVYQVQILEASDIQAVSPALLPLLNRDPGSLPLQGLVQVQQEMVQLLGLDQVLAPADIVALGHGTGSGEGVLQLKEGVPEYFCPTATSLERAIFAQRAHGLRSALVETDGDGVVPLALVGLGDEFFGIDLSLVREFCSLRQITPVPCCPPHVIGQMNLRGDILTLVDIRGALGMPSASPELAGAGRRGKVVVIEIDDMQLGLLVDEVFEVLHLHQGQIGTLPASSQHQDKHFLKGTALWGEAQLSILDLPEILAHGALIVNEEV